MALSHLGYDDAAEMLGVWMALNGNRKKLVFELKAKAVAWGQSRKPLWKGSMGCSPLKYLSNIKIPTTCVYLNQTRV